MVVARMTSVESNRRPIFLDIAYVNALVNTRDQWHDAAVQWQRKLSADKRRLVTTEFVLVEIADGLAAVRFRVQAVGHCEDMRNAGDAESWHDVTPHRVACAIGSHKHSIAWRVL